MQNRHSLQVPASDIVKKLQFKYAQKIRIIRKSAAMETPDALQKLPTPWLADSEWLLAELTKTRETVLRIPFQLDNASDIKAAIDRIWNLERTLRDLLHYHRDGQRHFAKQSDAAEKRTAKASAKSVPKIIRLRA